MRFLFSNFIKLYSLNMARTAVKTTTTREIFFTVIYVPASKNSFYFELNLAGLEPTHFA